MTNFYKAKWFFYIGKTHSLNRFIPGFVVTPSVSIIKGEFSWAILFIFLTWSIRISRAKFPKNETL